MNSKYHIHITSHTLFLGSLQAHCMKKPILGGIQLSIRNHRFRTAKDSYRV